MCRKNMQNQMHKRGEAKHQKQHSFACLVIELLLENLNAMHFVL